MSNQIQIPIEQFTDFTCFNVERNFAGAVLPPCQGKTFSQVILVKTYKGFLSANKTIVAHIPVLKCEQCGAIHNLNQ